MFFTLLLLPLAVLACGPGSTPNTQQKCLTLYTTPMTWPQAEQFCINRGGHLASIHNGYDSSLTNLIAAPYCKYYYIGASCTNARCSWVDFSTWNYNNWQKNEPGYLPYLSVNSDNAEWKTVNGANPECFICATNN